MNSLNAYISIEYESDRLEHRTKRNELQAELTVLQDKNDKQQEELRKMRKLAIQRPVKRGDSPDDHKENCIMNL